MRIEPSRDAVESALHAVCGIGPMARVLYAHHAVQTTQSPVLADRLILHATWR